MSSALDNIWYKGKAGDIQRQAPTWLQAMWNEVLKQAYSVGKEVGKTLEDIYRKAIAPTVNQLWKNLGNDLEEFYKRVRDGKIAEAMEIAGKYVLGTIGIVAVLDLAETKVAGTGLELKGIKVKIMSMLRFEEWFGAFVGGMIGTAVGKSAEYLANSIVRPTIPSAQDTAQLRYENKISQEEFYKYMAFHGFPNELSDLLFEIWDYTPSFYVIERICKEMEVPDTVLQEWLNKNRMVNTEHRKIYEEYFAYVAFKEEFKKIESALRSLYEYGFIDEKVLDEAISKIKPSRKQVEALKIYMEMIREKRLMYLQYMREVYLYRKGRIDENTLMDRLVKLGIDPDFAEAYVRLEASRKGIDWSPTVS